MYVDIGFLRMILKIASPWKSIRKGGKIRVFQGVSILVIMNLKAITVEK